MTYAHPWIADAVKVLKYLHEQPQDPSIWEQIDALLSGVPVKNVDLGFGSPADKLASQSDALQRVMDHHHLVVLAMIDGKEITVGDLVEWARSTNAPRARAALPAVIGPTTPLVCEIAERLQGLEGTESMNEVVAAVMRAYAASLPSEQPGARAVADRIVNEWSAAGKMPPMAWDFRGLVEAGINAYAASLPSEKPAIPEGMVLIKDRRILDQRKAGHYPYRLGDRLRRSTDTMPSLDVGEEKP